MKWWSTETATMANSKRKISFIQKYDLMVFIFFLFSVIMPCVCRHQSVQNWDWCEGTLSLSWETWIYLSCFALCVCVLFLHVITAIITASKYSFNARVKALCSNAYRRCLLPVSFFLKVKFFYVSVQHKKMQNSWFLLVVKTWKCRMIQSYLSCCVLTCSWLS